MRLRECSLLILVVLAMSLPAQASEWYPIDTGRFWVYSDAGGGLLSAAIEAPELFVGSIVQPLQWDNGPRECLSQDEDGRVFHHGLTGAPDGSYVVHDPPFLRMESDLTPGQEWETIYEVVHYSADGVEVMRQQARISYRVIGVGPVDVPAGTFQAAEVLITRELETLSLYTFRDWYAEGVGWIRRTEEDGTSVLFELEAYGPGAVPTRNTTWGEVKSLYR
jgi:hypothetical protein